MRVVSPCPCLLRSVEVNLPAVDLLETTLHFLHTGDLPPVAASNGDPDSFFGLLANAEYLMCEELTTACLDILDHHVRAGTHEPYTSHAGFSPQLIPRLSIARVLCTDETPPYRRVEVGLQWLAGFEGVPDDLSTLRLLTDSLVVSLPPNDVKHLSELYPDAIDALVRPASLLPMILDLMRTQTCTRCNVTVTYFRKDELTCWTHRDYSNIQRCELIPITPSLGLSEPGCIR